MFDVRPVADQEEYGRAVGAIGQYFNPPPSEEFLERFPRTLPHERMHAAFEDGQIVGGAGAFPFQMSVPGGSLPCGDIDPSGITGTPVADTTRGALYAVAFTTNFADGAVSRYAIGADGSLTLEDATAGLAVDGRPGLRDEGLSADGRFLYAIDADGGRLYGWSVDERGSLTPIGSWGGVPATVAGLAAR